MYKVSKISSRLRWRCRRGIRELDLLFNQFLDEYFNDLSEQEKTCFTQLLDEADLDIYDWISGKSQPGKSGYTELIKKLQHLK